MPVIAGTPVETKAAATTLLTTLESVVEAPTTIAPAVIPQALFNPIIDANNPAVAAAIAAYHVVDGIFDSSKPHAEASSESFPGYSEIRPVAPIQATKLDLYA